MLTTHSLTESSLDGIHDLCHHGVIIIVAVTYFGIIFEIRFGLHLLLLFFFFDNIIGRFSEISPIFLLLLLSLYLRVCTSVNIYLSEAIGSSLFKIVVCMFLVSAHLKCDSKNLSPLLPNF